MAEVSLHSHPSSPPALGDRLGEGPLKRVLVVDPDAQARRDLQVRIGQLGCLVDATDDPSSAIAALEEHRYDAVMARVGLLSQLDIPPEVLVVAVVERSERQAAIHAVANHCDCVVLPVDAVTLEITLHRLAAARRRARGERRAESTTPLRYATDGLGMVGVSQGMRDVFSMVEKVTPHKAHVLITGESGTGKELVARAIHRLGPRAHGPFVAINCGAIPATLLESELFGYRRGAFTDAVRDKQGLFEAADGGTLFLDEIGELSADLQVKLLRAIQEEEIRRIGDNETIKIDVRVVSATLCDLAAAIAAGTFREDLFYRLNVLPIALPPLRDRPEDIGPLVEHFLARHAAKHASMAHCPVAVSEAALEVLRAHDWPGNIRELENTIERAMVLCDGPIIEAEMLDDRVRSGARRIAAPPVDVDVDHDEELSIKKTSRALEQKLIRKALESTQGNRTNAAKLLEISHRALLYKIKEYGL
jgi:two-component system response regulator AtoC